MNVKEIYNTTGVLPHCFILTNGDKFETTTMQHSDGIWYAYIYQMKGLMREHLCAFATGATEKEAIEKLIEDNSQPQ